MPIGRGVIVQICYDFPLGRTPPGVPRRAQAKVVLTDEVYLEFRRDPRTLKYPTNDHNDNKEPLKIQ